jgi:hypothetical protein
MSIWRQKILNDFQEPVSPLTLVSDPDRLLLDEVLINEFQQRRIELIDYQDAVAFRCLYEQNYRTALMTGNTRLLVRTEDETEAVFPYDLLEVGRFLSYRITAFFSRLSASVIRQLGTVYLDELFAVAGDYQSAESNAETCDFILRRIFKIAVETIDNEAELLKLLLSKHYQEQNYPDLLEDYLIEQLSKVSVFKKLPIAELVSSAVFFYHYLQEKWVDYLEKLKNTALRETGTDDFYGTTNEPFEDMDVWRLMDNLFAEGKLQALKGYSPKYIPKWAYPGIVIDPAEDAKKRVDKLCRNIRERLQSSPDYRGWMQMAALWGGVYEQFLKFSLDREQTVITEISGLDKEIDTAFQSWVLAKFGGLKNLPYLPEPVLVHHIPHYLSSKHQGKTALLVLDGMSWVQWAQIRSYLGNKLNCEFEEKSVFAWVPTITSISRQAIFTGEVPSYFADSIDTTTKEPNAWKLFWENHGVIAAYTTYHKGLGRMPYFGWENFWRSTTKITGLVIDILDQFGHHGLQGQSGVYREIDLWLQNGYLEALLHDLRQQGFTIYLTSDHGNKESEGIGTIVQGVLAETRGERVRIYSDRKLRDQTVRDYNLINWPGDGLPENIAVLLAPGNTAFVAKDEVVISHGGISMEETLVPFVQIHWRE